jgi:curli biogenesis system outer membrane secretion channel CsgG
MRFTRFLACLALLGVLAGCAGAPPSAESTTAEAATPAQPAPANVPQTRIAISAFDYKGMQRGDVGQGLAELLTAALANSGRFVQATDAQWLIQGSVSGFEPACSAGSSIIVSGNQACVSLNLKIVDAASGRVLKAVNVDGSSDGNASGQAYGNGELPPGLGAYRKTPMELALRSCVDKAVKAIAAVAP